jgi:diketogulonate reductase-like aldo/keto reductase
VGAMIRESGVKREEIYITTKYSGIGGLSIRDAFTASLTKVRSLVLFAPLRYLTDIATILFLLSN